MIEMIKRAREKARLIEGATPGPWKAVHRSALAGPDDDEVGGLGWEIVGPPEPYLRGTFARAADARLAAAAPDMAELLGQLADWLEEMYAWAFSVHDAFCTEIRHAPNCPVVDLGLE